MAAVQVSGVVRQLERLFGAGSVTGMNEGQLLDRFVARRDEAAFEALVARHGPMVMGVCRQFLRDPNDVEDAFQATFLVLVRKAGTLRDTNLLGNWLYGVAYKVAVRARAAAARRHAKETSGVEDLALDREMTSQERQPWLHEEIQRLPDKYRVPLVLCYLEGLTHEEAADHLQWPVGTVKGRLSRARDLLRSRLTRKGLALPVGVLLISGQVGTASVVASAVPVPLVASTIKAAIAVAAGRPGAAVLISAQAVALSEGVLFAMSMTKLKGIAATLTLALAFVATGAGVYARQAPAEKNAEAPAAKPAEVAEEGPEPPKPAPVATPASKPAPAAPSAPAPGPAPGAVKSDAPSHRRALKKDEARLSNPPAMMGMGGGMRMGQNNAAILAAREHETRVDIAKMMAQLEADDASPKTAAVLKKLEQPISMTFPNETPLEDVLKYLKSATMSGNEPGVAVYVDPIGLKEVDASMTSVVTLDLEGIPVKTSLRLLLKQLRLAYCVKDGVLIISSVNGIMQELEEAGIDVPVKNGGFQ
ncbi:RNA polymerase sigma factor [Singulisphaera sp. PoT]|uniref:RNA polymerase sigma factor n=1 Tax=Singulisphaera sp. PoT TaxID=3411797 RepID=UPI003BF4CF86